MQTILDQNAIDHLFAAQGAGLKESVAEPPEAELAVLYNFGRAGQISNDQMRAISLVNDHFARNLMHTLGAWLRTQTQVVLVAGEQMPYGEFISRIPEPAYICLLRLEPLGGLGLMEIDLSLALTMVDLLLGGHGGADVTRDVTDIEDAILLSVIEVILRELNAAWEKVGLQFVFDKRDHEGKVPRLMAGAERTLCVSFDMQVLGAHGALNFCLPAVVLNTIQRRLLALSDESKPKYEAVTGRVAAILGAGRFHAVLRLPPVRLPSAAVRSLAPGVVLDLPLPKHAQAELLVGGRRLCGAQAVVRGEHRGAMIAGAVAVGVTSTENPVTAPISAAETREAVAG